MVAAVMVGGLFYRMRKQRQHVVSELEVQATMADMQKLYQ
jgi:hypothetical protein